MAKPKLVNVFLGDKTISICKSEGVLESPLDRSLITTSIKDRSLLFGKYYEYPSIPMECIGETRDLMWGSKLAKGWKATVLHFDFHTKEPHLADVSPYITVTIRNLRHENEMLRAELSRLKGETRDIASKDRYKERVSKDFEHFANMKQKISPGGFDLFAPRFPPPNVD